MKAAAMLLAAALAAAAMVQVSVRVDGCLRCRRPSRSCRDAQQIVFMRRQQRQCLRWQSTLQAMNILIGFQDSICYECTTLYTMYATYHDMRNAFVGQTGAARAEPLHVPPFEEAMSNRWMSERECVCERGRSIR
jgi:hypothetical protein